MSLTTWLIVADFDLNFKFTYFIQNAFILTVKIKLFKNSKPNNGIVISATTKVHCNMFLIPLISLS